jgi:regulator of RNase E activity RraA
MEGVTLSGPQLLAAFAALTSTSVSDALDALELPPGVAGLHPMWSCPKVVGFAATVTLEPGTGAPGDAHLGTTAVAAAGSDQVMVIAIGGRTEMSCWGGLLSLGAAQRGVRGAIVDGACRDVDEARGLGFPVYARASTPVTGRGRVRQRCAGEPVTLAGVTVSPGDVVVADETGIVAVPRARAEEVLAAATAITERERAIADDVRGGIPLPVAMRDARLAGIW